MSFKSMMIINVFVLTFILLFVAYLMLYCVNYVDERGFTHEINQLSQVIQGGR